MLSELSDSEAEPIIAGGGLAKAEETSDDAWVVFRRIVRPVYALPSSVDWMGVRVVVVAEYAALCRDHCVSSASSCRSWRRGVLGRADLSVAQYKPTGSQDIQVSCHSYAFGYALVSGCMCYQEVETYVPRGDTNAVVLS